MARRPKPHEEELPFVALMDTMTNVVGVLIIVLVMIGIGLAKSVRKVLSDLPPVTIEEHAKLLKEVEETKPKADPQKVEEEIKKLTEDAKKATEELKTMEVTKEKQNIKIVDLDDLQKQLAERKKERDAKKASVDKLLADIDKMKQQLDTTPVYVPPPAMVVKLPNPRPVPDKAEIHRFLVAGGKILFIDEDALADQAEAELKRAEQAASTSRETVKGPDGKPVMIRDKSGRTSPQRKITFDPKKLSDYFARLHLGSREIKTDLVIAPNSPRLALRMTPLPNSGETIDRARNLISVYQTQLKKFKADPKAVVWFHVFKDSIETYLQARDIADQIGVPVGWEITGNAFFTHYLSPEYIVPFKPGATPVPGTQPAVVIAPPKTTLD